MHRILMAGFAALAVAVTANPAEAQFKIGPQVALITSIDDFDEDVKLGNRFGLGGRVAVEVPMMPVGAYASGTYYFPDCGMVDCDYYTITLGARAGLPSILVSPYVTGGWQWKNFSVEGIDADLDGDWFVGVGVAANLGIELFLEANFEFNDVEDLPGLDEVDTSPLVFKLGALFGG